VGELLADTSGQHGHLTRHLFICFGPPLHPPASCSQVDDPQIELEFIWPRHSFSGYHTRFNKLIKRARFRAEIWIASVDR